MWANIGAFHMCLWTFTMTEAWAWSRAEEELVDRSTSPWDTASRRPSHADKRRAWRRVLLGEEIRLIRILRAPELKKADMLIPIGVAFKGSKPGGQHVHQSVVSRVRYPWLPLRSH